jgi:hypothetical protein
MKTSLIRRNLLVCFVSLVCSTGAQAKLTRTAERCGANQDEPPARVFADSSGKGWREYKSAKAVPELELNVGSAAQVWPGTNGSLLVHVQEPGEDFAAYTDYCFDQAGKLTQLRYELRTAWGWGYRQEGPAAGKNLKPETSEFFDTKTGQHIERPEQASDVADALEPRIYRQKSELPFFKLLPKGMV